MNDATTLRHRILPPRPLRALTTAGLAALAGLLLLSPGPRAAGQLGTHQGKTIELIEVEGLNSLARDTILFYLGLEEGQPLDEVELNERIRDLWGRKLIDDLVVEAHPAPGGGVRLVLQVTERPILRSITYEGLKRINQSDVSDRILRDNVQVLEGGALARGELERVKAILEDLYREKGYRFAEASYVLEDLGRNEFRVSFTVDEGDRVRIGDIDFTGNDVFGDLRLQWTMKGTKESNFINRLLKKDIYNPAKLEEDLDRVRDLYRQRGYKNVAIGEPVIEVVARRPEAPTPEQSKRRMHLQIPVSEGERWRLGEITINGNERFSDQQLLQTFEIRGGTWLRSKKIDDALKTINDIYQNSGFLYARAQPELKEREGQVADLVVRIQEGDQFTVRRIEFEGNVRTRDKVLRRELRVQEGYLMNTGALRSSVFKVNQLGYFQLNQEDPVNIDVDGEAKKVDLVFQGEEADRTELSFGGGYSDNFGFEGQFGLRTRNFLGRGETLSANLQRGQFREVVDVSYFVPWFLDRPQTIGFQVFDTTFDRFFGSDNQNVQQERRGATFTYGRSFKLFQQLSFAVSRSELDDFFPTSIDDDGDLEFQRFERRFSSVTPSWTMDSRDSRFEPTRGRRFLATVQFAGGSLGGDTELIRPEVALSFFKPVTRFPLRTVFAINAQGGYVELNEDSIISPLDRFFLGGESSIRGHARNTISVRDENGERRRDPDLNLNFVGGEAFLQFNVEYHVLLGGPLRALLFYDAGNVFADDQFDDLFNLRQTAGIELRLLLPVFGAPLRFIYATNLDELPNDDFESFQFSIGSSF